MIFFVSARSTSKTVGVGSTIDVYPFHYWGGRKGRKGMEVPGLSVCSFKSERCLWGELFFIAVTATFKHFNESGVDVC